MEAIGMKNSHWDLWDGLSLWFARPRVRMRYIKPWRAGFGSCFPLIVGVLSSDLGCWHNAERWALWTRVNSYIISLMCIVPKAWIQNVDSWTPLLGIHWSWSRENWGHERIQLRQFGWRPFTKNWLLNVEYWILILIPNTGTHWNRILQVAGTNMQVKGILL